MSVSCQTYEIGAVRMDVIASPGNPNGQSMIRLLDMDSAAVVELRGCQRARLQDEFHALRASRDVTAIPVEEFFELAGQLQRDGCTCDARRCDARGRVLRLVLSRHLARFATNR